MVAFAQQSTGPGRSESRAGQAEPARPAADGYAGAMMRQRLLARAVSAEVLPRLVLSHRAAALTPASEPCWSPAAGDVAELATLVIGRDETLPLAFVSAMRGRGATLEQLYLDLLTPAARLLGEQWEDDAVDFMQVTSGLGRLQHLVHEMSPSFVAEISRQGHGRRALMLPAPGEQHTFGLSMVVEFFRRGGWDVWTDPAASRAEMVDLVRANWYAVVGFSVAGDECLDALASVIRAVRRASRNRGVGVMVGGPVFVAHPEMAALVGADATAADGRHAVMQAQNLLAMLPGRD